MKTSFGTGFYKDDAKQCVIDATKNFINPKLIFFFSSEKHFPEYAQKINELFPDALSIGCTTYRTINREWSDECSLDVLAVEDGIICSGGVIEKADNTAMNYADDVKKCLNEVGTAENTVCVEFVIPMINAEEYALMVLNSVLLRNEIPVFGGSAVNSGADSVFKNNPNYVAMNGVIYTEGCVFVLIHSESGKIKSYLENIYEPLTGNELYVTKANSITRTVMEYDNMPASQVYANEIGVDEDEIEDYFFYNPIGRLEGDEIFNTAIHEKSHGRSIKHFGRIHEGTRMMVMKEGDYEKIIRQTIEKIKSEVPVLSFVLVINCVARTILFERKDYIDEYNRMLSEAFPNMIGISTYGEQMGTKNLNHSAIFVVFE